MLNLSKRIVADGEGATKFISISVLKSKTQNDAKSVAFSIANSNLVKTAIAGEDPDWGRIIMAIGKSGINFDTNKLSINFGDIKVVENGKIFSNYNEREVATYMKSSLPGAKLSC